MCVERWYVYFHHVIFIHFGTYWTNNNLSSFGGSGSGTGIASSDVRSCQSFGAKFPNEKSRISKFIY